MVRGQRLEAIDTRWVFRIYAVLALAGGFFLFAWGQRWIGNDLPGLPWGKAALVRVAGAVVMAAGFCSLGFAAIEHPSVRRRALLWFTIAHGWIWFVMFIQQAAIWNSTLGDRTTGTLLVVTAVLSYLFTTSEGDTRPLELLGLFGSSLPAPTEALRSQYEQQIREAARQEERNRLARDLHDAIKQQLFVIQTAAATAQARFDDDSAGARLAVEQVRGSAREAMADMQAMLDQLRAVPLENAGLIEALKKQAEALGFRTGARVDVKVGELPASSLLPPGAHEAILRVAQEALANIGRHARASNVVVSLDSVHGQAELRIQDDGAGFDPSETGSGQGLNNMRARAREFQGAFELATHRGGGTTIVFAIPHVVAERPEEYRRKMLLGVVTTLPWILLACWLKDYLMILLAAAWCVGVARYWVAYRRAQQQAGALR